MWSGCPAVASIQNSIDSLKPLSNDDSGSFSPVGSSSVLDDIAGSKDLSNEKESDELSNEQENDADADNSECHLSQPSRKHRKVEEMLNARERTKI